LTSLRINGAEQQLDVPDHELLLDTLRERLGLFSVREGCGVGACGTCTVLLDGRPASSCLLFTSRLEGHEIMTSEGLGGEQNPAPVQRAFIEAAGFQCGYCTPGFVLTVQALVEEHPNPTEQQIKDYLAGNLCRCGAYPNILEAVRLIYAVASGR
jgi:aerobic-type carbon monoxide dehydrogenase small subunit (CoxS/CutS family)